MSRTVIGVIAVVVILVLGWMFFAGSEPDTAAEEGAEAIEQSAEDTADAVGDAAEEAADAVEDTAQEVQQ
jgi:hypothetical protein